MLVWMTPWPKGEFVYNTTVFNWKEKANASIHSLIDVDEYAEKLRRLDSLDTAQEDELERIRGESTGTRQEE